MNKINFLTKRIDLTIVFVSMIMMLIVLTLPFKAKPFGDITFHEESKNLALFIKGKIPFEKVLITKAPGPILFYTPAYLLAPSDATDNQLWVYGVIFTSIIITISLLLIFRIGTSFFSKEIGLLSILLLTNSSTIWLDNCIQSTKKKIRLGYNDTWNSIFNIK